MIFVSFSGVFDIFIIKFRYEIQTSLQTETIGIQPQFHEIIKGFLNSGILSCGHFHE